METFDNINKPSIVQRVNSILGTEFPRMDIWEWEKVSRIPNLPENFIDEFRKRLHWKAVSQFHTLNRDFMEKYKGWLIWSNVMANHSLNEELIETFWNRFGSGNIPLWQPLSEDFMRKHMDELNWVSISIKQKMSEGFIEEFWGNFTMVGIIISQMLSEGFIRRHAEEFTPNEWFYLSEYQRLSEKFIRDFQDKVDWYNISMYQKTSDAFANEFEDEIYWDLRDDNRANYTREELEEEVKNTGLYECYEDYFIAYKAIMNNRYSKYNFTYRYLPGETYESWCDCSDSENSFGLSCGTMLFCRGYKSMGDIIIKVKVKYEDVGRVVHCGNKIRCFKFEVLD